MWFRGKTRHVPLGKSHHVLPVPRPLLCYDASLSLYTTANPWNGSNTEPRLWIKLDSFLSSGPKGVQVNHSRAPEYTFAFFLSQIVFIFI